MKNVTPLNTCDFITNHFIQCDFCRKNIENFEIPNKVSLPTGNSLNLTLLIVVMVSILLVLLIA